ncbi:hypothetical protein BJ138DRAFT_1234068 [Hygrophoropsis aurantiaca]|uniref:Uncharacterized protein n=1 Tax=Hygrophoropsis aurantiaca TaxID=72124 RepID=A0ACB7ZUQ2_9AGAM|nr:hypothetical protein BJ138DRAFT_1234068 [Hygrophoropsis aurantiaca]
MTPDESMSTAANSDTHENSTGRDRIEANSSSWAARNPGQPVIPIRPAPARKTGAELASLKIASEQKKAKEELFHTALKEIADTQHNLIVEAAAAHDVTVEKALRLYNGYRNYAPSRKAQLSNALLHAKAKEVNQAGAKYTTKEIRELIKDDPDMRDLDSDQEQAFIEQLNEHRKLQKFGLRANNTAAARDMLCTLDNVCGTLDSMARRTGSYAVFFATRGHVNDLGEPTWHGTDNAMDFFEDVLGLEADDICRKFEQWACTRNENGLERDSLLNVRRACIRFIKSGLNALIGKNKGISMNYENYEKNIMQKYRVQLIGWPTDIPFVSPSKINTITEARKLRDALKDGTCHWAPMSAKEVEAHTKSIETRLAEGVKVGKPRAPRADKGRARGKRAGRGKENSQPSKRAKAISSQPKRNAPTSAATVEDSEEDEESENDDD